MMQKNEARMLNFLRAYLEAIKIFKTEPEYTLKALSQFSKVNDQGLLKEAYEYNRARIPDVPYPSLVAMQAVVDTLGESDPKAAKADAKKFINDRFLKSLRKKDSCRSCSGDRKAVVPNGSSGELLRQTWNLTRKSS